MLQMQTKLGVADNSGAKVVVCIKVLGGSHHMLASIGSIVIVSIKETKETKENLSDEKKLKKGAVCRAVVVRTKYGITRKDGTKIRFDTNDVVILDKQNVPIGSRIFGPITQELRNHKLKFTKIISLAKEVL